MAVETLAQFQPETAVYLRELHGLGLINIAFIGWLWRKLKENHSKRTGIPLGDLEIDHIIPEYKGGSDDPKNLRVRTRVDHAKKHYRAAEEAGKQRNQDDWRAERWSVGQIWKRMTKRERREFNDWVTRREQEQ